MLFGIGRRKSLTALRTLYTSPVPTLCRIRMEGNAQPKEIKIPVPYGNIAGKVWNEGGSTPLLCLHGWMDNAGTWDTLAPLLPRDVSLIAIDFPGHGRSSYVPAGTSGVFMDLTICIERIVQHFGWKEVNLLGHSMGGGAAMMYATTFPEKVKKVIMVDILKAIETPAEKQPDRTARAITELLEAETKLGREPRHYEYSEIVDKLVKGYNSSITEESAKILLERGSVKHPDGLYSFSYDPRLKVPNVLGTTFEQQKGFANRLQCELLIIKAKSGPLYEKKEHLDEMLSIYGKKAKKFIYEEVDGTHHVHMNDPKSIAPLITEFMKNS